jgi:hypothetical protein
VAHWAWQEPLLQTSPALHAFPQEPQFFGSVVVLMHDPEHMVSPVGH